MGYKAIAALLAVATAACSLLVSLDELTAVQADGGVGADGAMPDAACTNTLTDPENCGACGHSCCGGSCSRGVCTPVNLVSGLPTTPIYLVADASGLYWIDGTGAQAWRSELDGTNRRQVLFNVNVTRILPFDQGIYFDWADAGMAYLSLEGGAPSLVWKGSPRADPAADATRIFWTVFVPDGGPCAQGCVMSALHDGGDSRVSATTGLDLVGEGTGGVVVAGPSEVRVFPPGASSATPSVLLADAAVGHPVADERVYFGDYAAGTIFGLEWDASVSALVQGQGGLKAIAARGDDLAWTTSTGLRSCKVHDCKGTVQTLATDDVGTPDLPSIQGACVYWVSPSLKAIRRTGL
jgi:hypothetical protein